MEQEYSEYGNTKVRSNGMSEFVLKKIPSIKNQKCISQPILDKLVKSDKSVKMSIKKTLKKRKSNIKTKKRRE